MTRRRLTTAARLLLLAPYALLSPGCLATGSRPPADPIRDGTLPPAPVLPASVLRSPELPTGKPTTAALAAGLNRPLLGTTPLAIPVSGPLTPSEATPASGVPGYGPPPGFGPSSVSVGPAPSAPAAVPVSESGTWAEAAAELTRRGALEQSLSRGEDGDWHFNVRFPDATRPDRRVRYEGRGATPDVAVRDALAQVRAAGR